MAIRRSWCAQRQCQLHPMRSRWVRVEFMSTNPTVGEWEFHPVKNFIEVHPGQLYEATFVATNLIAKPVVAQAGTEHCTDGSNTVFS